MKEFLQELGINITLSMAGFMGSLLMIGKTAVYNLKQTAISLITGVASANYLTPIVCDIIRINADDYQNGIAFVLGFLGLKGVEALTQKFFKEKINGTNIEK